MELKYLSGDEQTALRNHEKLFSNAAYKGMVEAAEERIASLRLALENANDIREVKYYKGQIDALMGLVAFENNVLAQFEAITDSRKEDELEIEESQGSNL